MRDTFGNALSFTVFGESHGAAIGGVVQGLCAGVKIDEQFIKAQMQKRRAVGKISTPRTEADEVVFLSGVKNGCATGSALSFNILNTNTNSSHYKKTQNLLRPGHADYTAHLKYKGFQDERGGGHFSGRLTAPLVAAGSIFLHLLQQKNILIETQIKRCAGIDDECFSSNESELKAQILQLQNSNFGTLSQSAKQKMIAEIERAQSEGDSVGGLLQTVITGIPGGLGEPMFSSFESVVAQILFGIPALKGVSFGAGFAFADMRASEANDAFCMSEGQIKTKTNNNGGINGGITNAMPVIINSVIKPTPSIFKKQETVDFANKKNAQLEIEGRHDPCIVHRARVVQTCAVAIAVADLCNLAFGTSWQEGKAWNTGL